MAFHAGVRQFLAEHAAMERVEKISSVSGGSLLVGLLWQLNDMRRPTSGEYLSSVLLKLEETLTSKDLAARCNPCSAAPVKLAIRSLTRKRVGIRDWKHLGHRGIIGRRACGSRVVHQCDDRGDR